MYRTVYSLNRKLLVSSHEKVLGIFWATLQVMQDGDIVQVGRNEDILGGAYLLNLVGAHQMWKLKPRDRTITLTKLLIKHAKLTPKETKIGAYH